MTAKITKMHKPAPAPSRRARLAATTLAVAALAGCATAQPTLPPAPANAEAPPTQAELDAAARQKEFAAWVTAFRTSALAAGIGEETLRVAFDAVQYVPRAVELDAAQPEFTRTVWEYIDRAVTPQRVALGRDKLSQLRAEADAAAARYGVSADGYPSLELLQRLQAR